MKDAEKMLCDYIHDFVDDNWDKIDKPKIEIEDSKRKFLERIKTDVSDALWVLFEVANWGMDKKYLRELFVEDEDCEFRVVLIGTHYLKIMYWGNIVEFTYPKEKTVVYFE